MANPQRQRPTLWVALLALLLFALSANTDAMEPTSRLGRRLPRSAKTGTPIGGNLLADSHNPPSQSAPMTLPRGGGGGSKLSNLRERTLSAVLMLGGLVLWLNKFQEKGLIVLMLIVQAGLYREGTSVVQDKASPKASSLKWWWFLAYELALVGPRLLDAFPTSGLFTPTGLQLASFGMVALGLVAFVVNLNNSMAFAYEFQLAVQELSLCHTAVAVLMVPSSFWIATIQDFGMKYVLFSLYVVMINDTMAYLFGICFGKHPLLPTISPKKTWEGFVGALGSTLALSVLLWDKMGLLPSGRNHALAIAAYCSLVAPFGGFLASITKRAYGKKDFSNMIAGHGGFIDRLDCQIVTAPFMYLYLKQFVGLPGKTG